MNDRQGDDKAGSRPADQHNSGQSQAREWHVLSDPQGAVVVLTGDWIASDGGGDEVRAAQQIFGAAGPAGGERIAFDSNQLGQWDSTLLVFVATLRQEAAKRTIRFDDTGLPDAAARLLALSSEAIPVAPRARTSGTLLSLVGQTVIDSAAEAVSIMALIGDTVLSAGRVMRGGVRMRAVDLLTCVHEAGVAALPIVTIVNLLVGAILAFVGAVQLQRFGADIFVADLIGVAMTREMVALMTAIVVSGRTGGAYAAHIATMQGNEEIDALRVIGIPINDYLILPRLLALIAMMPLLYLYGCAVGIFGGFVVSVAMLNLSSGGFIDELRYAVDGTEVLFGLVKSIAFGALIAIVGCRAGLRAGRSAADVGQAATKAVVVGIVGVIALDAVFAICAKQLGF